MPSEEVLSRKLSSLWRHLNERQRRLVAAAEARALGPGGIAAVCRAAPISRPTVERGLRELEEDALGPPSRSRRPGGGRKRIVDTDPTIVADLDALVKQSTRGDPEAAILYTTKSTRTLAAELAAQGHGASYKRVGEILHQLNYSLQANAKVMEGAQHPDRDAHLKRNEGWVSVGSDHDTATFAAETIRRWWRTVGSPAYPKAKRLLICADAGGSNGYRLRLWKLELARLATEIGIPISVCHFPPGTSKWNRIEHRLFSAISMNWRGQPLTTHEVVVQLIGATTTRTGLRVHAHRDDGTYPKGVKVSKAAFAEVEHHLVQDAFHGTWNYTLRPGMA